MDDQIRIAYVEDHKVIWEGVSYLLSQYSDIEVIEREFDPEHASEFIESTGVDLFILDLQLGITKHKRAINGFELCSFLTHNFPGVKVIAHSMFDDVENINRVFQAGALGFVSKKSGHVELLNAIRQVMEGKRFLCREITKKTKNPVRFVQRLDTTLKGINELFSKAEKSVLEKIAKGFSTKQIAQQLGVSEKTVETHRKHLFDKAKVKNVAELMAYAYSRSLLME